MSSGELAKMLGVRYYQLDYARRIGAIPEPRRVGGKAYWTEKEIEAVRAYFNHREGVAAGATPRLTPVGG